MLSEKTLIKDWRLEKGTTRSGVEVPSSGREVMQYLYW
ncbi:hypothetical protein J008_06065 [Cryptococcus neoformans]|nr:hypothetical protein J008_06065 [Cryptococcus neoformans var. grubii]